VTKLDFLLKITNIYPRSLRQHGAHFIWGLKMIENPKIHDERGRLYSDGEFVSGPANKKSFVGAYGKWKSWSENLL
jgi:hypothetical protein